jgi:hypothetical protein
MLVPGRFSSAAIGIGKGELELRLSGGGNWQVKIKPTDAEDWRLLCRGHIDGTIFETARAEDQERSRLVPAGRSCGTPRRSSRRSGALDGAGI